MFIDDDPNILQEVQSAFPKLKLIQIQRPGSRPASPEIETVSKLKDIEI